MIGVIDIAIGGDIRFLLPFLNADIAVILLDAFFFRRLRETADTVVGLGVGAYSIYAEFQLFPDMFGLEAHPLVI